MSDFQIGDRVRILGNPYLCRELREGTIHKIHSINGEVALIVTEDYPQGLSFRFIRIEKFELSRESLPERFRFKVRSRKHLRSLIPLFNEIGIYLHGNEDLQGQINNVPNFQKHHWICVGNQTTSSSYLVGNRLENCQELEEIPTEQIDMILGLS